jgi:hypothetical protein
MNKMSFFEVALQTNAAKAAIGHGLITLFQTGSLDKGIDAMFGMAKRNGALTGVKTAILLDILRAIFKG